MNDYNAVFLCFLFSKLHNNPLKIMYTTYHLNTSELDENFLNAVKSQFQDSNLTITIEKEMDETEYLMTNPANKRHLLDAMENVKNGNVISFTFEEFEKMSDDLLNRK
jgi:antitoxin YefM